LTRDTNFRDISMTRRMIDIESDVDVRLASYLGSVASISQVKSDIVGTLSARLNWWFKRGWISYGEDGLTGAVKAPYEITFPELTISEFNTGVVRVTLKIWLAPTIEHIIIKTYRNQ
jgi:hypothetical protein